MKTIQAIFLLVLIIFVNCDDTDHCSDGFESYFKMYCENININTTHRCLYSNGKCELHFQGCSSYTGTDSSICENIPASRGNYKCKLQSNKCTEVLKECNEHEEGKTTCSDLDAGISKRCVLSNGECKSHYNDCNIPGTNKEFCEANIPSDPSKECYWDNACKERKKQCSDTKNTAYNSCSSIIPEDTNKKCVESGENCKEEYRTCELYDTNTQSSAKNKNDCESIKTRDEWLDYFYYQRCVFDSNTKKCSTGTSCSQFTYELGCIEFTLPDANKRCVFINGVCEEHYITCELYNEKETSKTKEACEKITPYYHEYSSEIDSYNKCVFEDSKCLRKKKPCSEISEKGTCNNQVIDDDTLCVYENNKCTEIYMTCEAYDKKTPSEKKNEADCKATKEHYSSGGINYYYKCVYENNSCKRKELTKCEDYEPGQDEKYCTQIYLNSYKGCAIKDSKCVEVYKNCPNNEEKLTQEQCEAITLNYINYICKYDQTKGCYRKVKECSDYKGNDKTACESTILYDEDGNLDYEYKCVWDNGCKKELKKCEDAKNEIECNNIITPDNKKCIYINDECKEQYKDCESYNNNGKEQIEQSVCESIILNDYLFNTDKCSFEPGNPNKCVRKKRETCSDFKRDDFAFQCYSLHLSSSSDKCSYSNSACATVKKTCLELSNELSVTEETCNEALTSASNKICSIKRNESGCEEKVNNNRGNYGLDNKKLVLNLLFIILGLLL